METNRKNGSVSKAALWVGWILTVLPVLMFLFSAAMKLANVPMVKEGFAKQGFPEGIALKLGILELSCALIYLFPRTAVLGAILLTGYLGGAIVTHLRIGEPIIMPVLFGILIWGGVYLRDPRLRALIPFRCKPASAN